MIDRVLLFAAVALLALASPLVKWLVEVGGPNGYAEPNSISFCNVLFVGNLCAAVVTGVAYGPRRTARTLRTELPRVWPAALLNLAFAVLIPTLIFIALETTSVVNLAFLGRFESVAFAAVGVFLGVTVTRGQWVGYGVIAVGVILLAFLESMGMPSRGDVLIVVAAVLQGIAAHATRPVTARTGVASFVVFRNLGSAVTFFVIAVWLYGFEHFMDAFGPRFWVAMTVYAALAVAGGQLAWYRSLARVPGPTIASFAMLAPVFGIFFAWVLLSAPPSPIQWAGGAVVGVGMVILRWSTPPAAEKTSDESSGASNPTARAPVEGTLGGG
ncbi:MAG: DMT family transporter [Planctomycetota bacterium]